MKTNRERIEPTSADALVRRMVDGWEPDFLFFWGHEPKTRHAHVGRECLSQWYPAEFVAADVRFATAEHYMMYRKALLFGDTETAERIVRAKHPGEAKTLGRTVAGFDEETWKRERFAIVVAGSVAKFSQNAALKSFLLNTRSRVLVEASPRDAIWGIGLAESATAAHDPLQWRGLNLLGFALMQARSEIAHG